MHWHEHAREHLSRGDVAAALLILTEAVINLEQRMAATQADLDAKLAELTGSVTTLTTAVQALIVAVQNHPAAADFTNEVAAVQGAVDAIAAVATSATNATPPADTVPAA